MGDPSSICEEEDSKFVRTDAGLHPPVDIAVFHRLNEDCFWSKHKCILGDVGQEARGARRLLQRMATELKLPIYVLVDNDPWGLYIYSVLKQGSINLAYESRMAVPNVRFLGMSAYDYKSGSEAGTRRSSSERDIARAEQMKAYPWFASRKKWQREIQSS